MRARITLRHAGANIVRTIVTREAKGIVLDRHPDANIVRTVVTHKAKGIGRSTPPCCGTFGTRGWTRIIPNFRRSWVPFSDLACRAI
eukprot:3149989-Heterocapsa_arctica.AAC.1